LLLSASHWGSHHHRDSLNLYYWKNGHELLSDLGYLWDNPLRSMTVRTLAHNTVIIDEAEQETTNRGGEVKSFKTSAHVKVMRASSSAYPQAKRYERTSAIIDHGDGKSYVADFFFVEGGSTQDDIFHGPNQHFAADMKASPMKLYDLTNIRQMSRSVTWKFDDNTHFNAHPLPQDGEVAYVGDGWGQRDPFNADRGATLPYLVRRTEGSSMKIFTSVLESHPSDAPFVKNVRRVRRSGGIALDVETTLGTDYIESTDAGLRVTSQTGRAINWTFCSK